VAFISNGQAAVERLVPLGLAPTLLTKLQAQVERFEQAARASGHVKAVLATERAGIAAALAAGTRAIQRLNVIVTNTFAQNPVQLTEWKRVRRVHRKRAS
jgi:dTDP-4-amino-4,6-dideoxygalactose transaminase